MNEKISYSAVLLVGHGSRDQEGVAEFKKCVQSYAKCCDLPCAYGFLEFAQPTIDIAIEKLVADGHRHIIALPVMLTAAGHTKNDIPSELNALAEYFNVHIKYGADLGIHSQMLGAATDRIEQAEAFIEDYRRDESMLLVVGRGTSDPDANSNVAKISRMLWEGLNFGWAQTCYIGVTQPKLDHALNVIQNLPFRNVLVFPYFLFTGLLVKKIYHVTNQHPIQHHKRIIAVDYLNDHPQLLETMRLRQQQAVDGNGNMNCQMCIYREQIVGFEHLQGQAQQGHHFHVRGSEHDAPHDHKTGTK